MDIFGRKRIKELDSELFETKRKLERTDASYKALLAEFKELGRLKEFEPEGCKKGPWCKACEFVKTFTYYDFTYSMIGSVPIATGYACGKGESCVNFVQKKN